ncbi:hypothetical protein LguiA_004998 [Lonicera macranthoides]
MSFTNLLNYLRSPRTSNLLPSISPRSIGSLLICGKKELKKVEKWAQAHVPSIPTKWTKPIVH